MIEGAWEGGMGSIDSLNYLLLFLFLLLSLRLGFVIFPPLFEDYFMIS